MAAARSMQGVHQNQGDSTLGVWRGNRVYLMHSKSWWAGTSNGHADMRERPYTGPQRRDTPRTNLMQERKLSTGVREEAGSSEVERKRDPMKGTS